MQAAVEYVRRNPGCAILPVAKFLHVAAERGTNNALGYNPVHRAIDAGLITAKRGARRNTYALYVVES